MVYVLIPFKFSNSLRKPTQFVSGMGCEKDGAPHFEPFVFLSTRSRTTPPTSYLNTSSFIFSAGYGREHIGLVFYFNSKSNGFVLHAPSVKSNKSSGFGNKLSEYLCCSSVKF